MSPAARAISLLSKRQDLLLVAILLLTVAMMVLPFPPVAADILVTINIAIATILLMVAVYIKSASDFSTLPAIILVTTAFRLSLSITTSRMVLVQADAGNIIRTFGELVIAGNVVVGLVTYLIISIVQFVVITKGSERVAEVAARFSLDALPGRQMSIDVDLKNGDIDQNEARRRRTALQKESQLYGAMDGAMKFVKGDAIASLIIIAVNLIGGIVIGCVQHGMGFSSAVQTYSLLAVGDGLIAQIPALLISLTAGIIVTRVASERTGNLGQEMVGQVIADPRTLKVAGFVLGGAAFVPGFPMAILLAFAVLLFGGSVLLQRKQRADAAADFLQQSKTSSGPPKPFCVEVIVGERLAHWSDILVQSLKATEMNLGKRLGLAIPTVELNNLRRLTGAQDFAILVDGILFRTGCLEPNLVFVLDPDDTAALNGLEISRAEGPYGARSVRVSVDEARRISSLGLVSVPPEDYLVRLAMTAIEANAHRLVGIQETQLLMKGAESAWPDLVRETLRVCPLPRLSDVFRRLAEERVSISDMRGVMESVAEWAPRESATGALLERVRDSLSRQILRDISSGAGLVEAVMFHGTLEGSLRETLHVLPSGAELRMSREMISHLTARLAVYLEAQREAGKDLVVAVASDLRRPVWEFLRRLSATGIHVISSAYLASSFDLKIVGVVSSLDECSAADAHGLHPHMQV